MGRLLKIRDVFIMAEEATSSLHFGWVALFERQSSSALCSTSYTATSPSKECKYSKEVEQQQLHSTSRQQSIGKRSPKACPEAYAEFTQLQKLLQQYQRDLGAVGQAVSAFTEHLWQRKSASGDHYDSQRRHKQTSREELAAAEEELVASISQCEMKALLEAVRSLAGLKHRPDNRLLDAVVASLLKNVEGGSANTEEVAEMLSALAAFGYRPQAKSLDIVSDFMTVNLDQCSAEDISSLMNSMAAYGRTHFPLMAKIASVVRARGEEFSSEALADLLYSFAILRCDNQQMVDFILERILFELRSMSPAALSQLVSGLHLLNHRDAVTDVFLDALACAALGQLQHFSARQLATLAYNYGTLNHWGRNDQELLDAITIRMLHQHQELTPEELSNLVWAIARASHVSPRTNALLAVVTSHAAEVVDGFSPAQMTRMLHSLAQLSFHNKDLFDRAEVFLLERIAETNAEDLALSACAFARVMHPSSKLMPAVLSQLKGKFEELSACGLSGLVWGAAVVGELTSSFFELANRLLSTRALQEFTARDFVRLYQAELLMQIEAPQATNPPRLSEWLHGYAVRSLKDKLYLDRHAGNAQQEVCRCLMRLGIPYALENLVDGIVAVDIVLSIPAHPKIAIKVEQVSKYTTSRPQRPLADAVVTRRLLQARGWTLLCISEHEWVRLRAFEDKLNLLDERLATITGSSSLLQAA